MMALGICRQQLFAYQRHAQERPEFMENSKESIIVSFISLFANSHIGEKLLKGRFRAQSLYQQEELVGS